MTYRRTTAALAWIFLIASAAPVVSADENTITIHNFAFLPNSLSISTGTVVTWKNLDGEPHTVVSDQGLFRSEALDENDSDATLVCWCRDCQYFGAGGPTINVRFAKRVVAISGELRGYRSTADSGNTMCRQTVRDV